MIEDADKLDPALLRVIRALARANAVHDLDAIRRDQECETAARRSKPSFTQADVRRAIAAVEASGKSVGAIDFPPSGGFRIVIGEPMPTAARNEWDDVLQETPEQALERWKRAHKQDGAITKRPGRFNRHRG